MLFTTYLNLSFIKITFQNNLKGIFFYHDRKKIALTKGPSALCILASLSLASFTFCRVGVTVSMWAAATVSNTWSISFWRNSEGTCFASSNSLSTSISLALSSGSWKRLASEIVKKHQITVITFRSLKTIFNNFLCNMKMKF